MTVFSKLSIFWLVIGFTEYLKVRPIKCRRDDKNHKTRHDGDTFICKFSIFWVVIGFTKYLILRPGKSCGDDENHKTS